MLRDEIVIKVKSGDGGRGCESYIRRADRKMIPNGGDGGDGGDVIIRSYAQTGSLQGLGSKHLFRAESGELGKGKNRYGHKGKSLVLKVPCGTTVYDFERKLLLRDLVEAEEEVVAARGGRRGYGNHAGKPATLGQAGKSLELLLSYSVVTDAAMVGLPNSGKTTLLRLLTGAHVEPSDHPFDTRSLCLGTYHGPSRNFRICDLPSVYAYSTQGRGLGNAFLKHLKRARLIFLVLDVSSSFEPDLKKAYKVVSEVIREFDPRFSEIERFVVVNKTDLANAKELAALKRLKFSDPVFFVSAKENKGIDPLLKRMIRTLVSGKFKP